ncbi:hypothetical protein AAVH_22453 [Aphelenchoides avenae]|nr:hypothetical protein AAVH_22453 [Aphelenchus avenae]
MLSTIWPDVLQFSTRADIETIQMTSGHLNAVVNKNHKSFPLRRFTFLWVKGCREEDREQTVQYYFEARTETENQSAAAFDSLLRKLSNGYVEQFQIDCFCPESFGLFLAGQPAFDQTRFGLLRYITDLGTNINNCMLATVVTFAAIQFRPAGFLLSWDGSLNGPTMVALRIPVIRDSIRQLVLHADASCFMDDKAGFLLDFLTSAHCLETCTLCSLEEPELILQWLSAFIKRFTNSQERGHRFSRLCLSFPCDGIDDNLGESVQSKFSNSDSELGYHPNRVALEQDLFKLLAPQKDQVHWNFSTTGKGRVNRYENYGGRQSLCLFTWEAEIQCVDEHETNEIDADGKVGFGVIEISESA